MSEYGYTPINGFESYAEQQMPQPPHTPIQPAPVSDSFKNALWTAMAQTGINQGFGSSAAVAPSVATAAPSAPQLVSAGGQAISPSMAGAMGGALPWLGVAGIGAGTAATAYNAYKDSKGKGLVDGFKQGVKSAGPLNFVPLLGQAAWLGGALGGMFGGTTDEDTLKRRAFKTSLGEQSGLGSELNFNTVNGPKSLHEYGYNVDFSNPMADQAVGWVQPLAMAATGDDGKLRDDYAGELANLALSNATSMEDLRKNVLSLYESFKADPGTLKEAINQNQALSQDQKDSAYAAIDNLTRSDNRPQDLTELKKKLSQPKVDASPQPPMPNMQPQAPQMTENKGRPAQPIQVPQPKPQNLNDVAKMMTAGKPKEEQPQQSAKKPSQGKQGNPFAILGFGGNRAEKD